MIRVCSVAQPSRGRGSAAINERREEAFDALTTFGFCRHRGTHAPILHASERRGRRRCSGCLQCHAEAKADHAAREQATAHGAEEANVAKTILTIPSTLPARLTTIQKSCLAKAFDENPASCREGSDIGSAVVHTPSPEISSRGPDLPVLPRQCCLARRKARPAGRRHHGDP